MPVEIRELIIKTEVKTVQQHHVNKLHDGELLKLKKELLDTCKRLLKDHKKTNYKR